MADQEARHRRWTNVVVILTGLYALAFAVWSPPLADPGEAAGGGDTMWWTANALGGALALAAVPVALRSRSVGRILLGAASAALGMGLLAFDRLEWVALATLLAPAVLLLLCIPFFGPMPVPEEEGRLRGDPR